MFYSFIAGPLEKKTAMEKSLKKETIGCVLKKFYQGKASLFREHTSELRQNLHEKKKRSTLQWNKVN